MVVRQSPIGRSANRVPPIIIPALPRLAGCVFFSYVALGPLKAQTQFLPLGYLDGNGPTSEANAITPDGSKIVGYSTTNLTSNQACWWTIEGIAQLPGTQDWYANSAYGISADGNVIVGDRSFGGTEEAFSWTPAGQIQPVPLPDNPGSSTARSVSGSGQIIVGSARLGGLEWKAFRWDRNQASAIYLPQFPSPAVSGGGFDVSYDGRQIVGQVQTSLTTYAAAHWIDGAPPVLFSKAGDAVIAVSAQSISDDGSVVVGSGVNAGGQGVAFKWTAAGGVRALPNPTTGVYAILGATAVTVSGNGSVIVGYGENAVGREEALFWVDEQPFRVSDIALAAGVLPPSWEPFRAYGVDYTGNAICGYGQATSGKLEGYVLVMDTTPEPPALTLPTLRPVIHGANRALSVRFHALPGLSYRLVGGAHLHALAPLGVWHQGEGVETELDVEPTLTRDASRFFLQVEVRGN